MLEKKVGLVYMWEKDMVGLVYTRSLARVTGIHFWKCCEVFILNQLSTGPGKMYVTVCIYTYM